MIFPGNLLRWVRFLFGCVVVLGLGILPPRFCFASGTVTNCNEAELRTAMAGGGLVRFACDGIITLSNTLTISPNVILDGTGHQVTLSGNNARQVFSVGGNAELSLTNLTIANGRSTGSGGGISVNLFPIGKLNAVGCTFRDNYAGNNDGGAIYCGGALRLTGCTFMTNAARQGAAINMTLGGSGFGARVTNCTFVGNVVTEPLYYFGGAFWGGNADQLLVNCTFTENKGGGVSVAKIVNTIVANSSGVNCYNVYDGGHNISSDGTGNFTTPFSRTNTDPKLGPLANYGGSTLTMSLLPGSPAIDAGDITACPTYDQRGEIRPYSAGCDVGAFEATVLGSEASVFRFTAAAYRTEEVQPTITIAVSRENGAAGTTSVNFATSDVNATAGSDYLATNGSLIFMPGEVTKSFTVQIIDDTLAESDESLSLSLSAPTGGATLGSLSTATLTILDNETIRVVAACNDALVRTAVGREGRVQMACDGTILLTNALTISNNVVLEASGRSVILSGGNTNRLFIINPGAKLTLLGLILANGLGAGLNGTNDGGINHNATPGGAGEGGAIYNNGGMLVAQACTFYSNRAQGGNGGSPAPDIVPPCNCGTALPGAGGAARGGAVFNGGSGVIAATNCLFLLNSALGGAVGRPRDAGTSANGGMAAGGAIFNDGGIVRLTHTSLGNNIVQAGVGLASGGQGVKDAAQGGALCNRDGEFSLTEVELFQNSSTASYFSGANGGAISHLGGALAILSCQIYSNGVQGGLSGGDALGGAIYVGAGTTVFRNSTLVYNIANGDRGSGGAALGGGLYTGTNVIAFVTNCTFFGNRGRGGGNANGGAICNLGGTLSLVHATIAGNAALPGRPQSTSVGLGGGIFASNGVVNLVNSIVANNPDGSNCFGTIVDGGHNLSSDGSARFTAPGSLNNTDPLLGPFADYGGPTPTVALLVGSPALNSADPAYTPATDQRGIARPFGGGADIGAFESAPPYSIVGRISGYVPNPDGILLTTGGVSNKVYSPGVYALHGFNPGTYPINPSSPECVFDLSNRLVTVERDTLFDIQSYRTNALAMERVIGGGLRGIFAGEPGASFRVLSSTGLQTWTTWSTNIVQSNSLFNFYVTNAPGNQGRFFRTVRP